MKKTWYFQLNQKFQPKNCIRLKTQKLPRLSVMCANFPLMTSCMVTFFQGCDIFWFSYGGGITNNCGGGRDSQIGLAIPHKYELKLSMANGIMWVNSSLAAPGSLAHRLHRRTASNAAPPATPHRHTACKIQNGRQGAPKWRTGLERCLPLGFWAFQATFAK